MTIRRSSRQQVNTVEALAARLPEELKGFGLRSDRREREAQIAAWINTQLPRQGAELVQPVMTEAGLTYLFMIRDQLTRPGASGPLRGQGVGRAHA